MGNVNSRQQGPKLMGKHDPQVRSRRWSKATAGGCFAVFLVVVGIWLWASAIHHYRPFRRPSCAVRLRSLLLQATALDNGVHLLCLRDESSRAVSIRFERLSFLGNAGYHNGTVISFLGFTVAILTHTDGGRDYIVPPHAAVVLPYWLLIIVCGYASLRFSGIGRRLVPFCRFSRLSWSLVGIAALVFLALNCVPSAWRLGAAIRPDSIRGWLQLTFRPSAYPEICLDYGYPFVCYRRAIINGEPVEVFHGDGPLGWQQHRAMENLCIGVAVITGLGIMVEFARRRHRSFGGIAPDSRPEG
jgi:hypothetical protein